MFGVPTTAKGYGSARHICAQNLRGLLATVAGDFDCGGYITGSQTRKRSVSFPFRMKITLWA